MEGNELTVEREFERIESRHREIIERALSLPILHEDIVIINRHDMDNSTWLEMSETNREGRRRSSWYGTVIAVSDIDSGDDVREGKKKKLSQGDTVIFNPESAYSLNIAGYPEIWILHVDSILTKDNNYNYLEQKKANVKKRMEIVREQAIMRMTGQNSLLKT